MRKTPNTKQVNFYPASQVKLLPGSGFYAGQKRMTEHLLSICPDQALYSFRRAAGLDTLGAPAMTGWDAEDCCLRGHTTGHLLSALALAWASTEDVRFYDKARYLVESLAECQQAFASSGRAHPGFLSAYSEEQFDLLEKLTPYPDIWAPYYTLDKIMAGLLDCYEYADIALAAKIARGMGDWVLARLSRLSDDLRQRMWSLYIAGEYGGMISVMVRLYALFGDERYLSGARLFFNDRLFEPLARGEDVLDTLHANQHIPQLIGLADMYETSGDKTCLACAQNFWEIVTDAHTYCIGGTGEAELFHAPYTESKYLTDKTAESCASVNMLKLTAKLFSYEPDGRYMDYYETTLINHILASWSPAADGGTTYFLPLRPGGAKEYSTTENTCCHGTGLESRFRFLEHLYASDGAAVYVNLYIDSGLFDSNTALELHSKGAEVFEIVVVQDMKKALRLRVPAWAQERFSLELNGERLGPLALGNGYVELPGMLKAGDRVILEFFAEPRVYESASDPSLVYILSGSEVMAKVSGKDEFLSVDEASEAPGLVPLNAIDKEPYHVYFRR